METFFVGGYSKNMNVNLHFCSEKVLSTPIQTVILELAEEMVYKQNYLLRSNA